MLEKAVAQVVNDQRDGASATCAGAAMTGIYAGYRDTLIIVVARRADVPVPPHGVRYHLSPKHLDFEH